MSFEASITFSLYIAARSRILLRGVSRLIHKLNMPKHRLLYNEVATVHSRSDTLKRKRHTRRTLRIFGLSLAGLIVTVGGLLFVQWRAASNPAALAHPILTGTAPSMSAAELSPDEVAPISLTPDIPCKLP